MYKPNTNSATEIRRVNEPEVVRLFIRQIIDL